MKQSVKSISRSDSSDFECEVNNLLKDGYKVDSTCISKRDVGSYDEYSVFQAILIKETEE